MLTSGREFTRAARYLRKYTGQEPEGNQPTLAEARKKLVAAARQAAVSDHRSSNQPCLSTHSS
jgi:hypothetical protein